ncbi:Pentatricopeptide repeat [Macleaya cordata]|uniref:Pentatricopeptide repeat n=1 Tax=Macleaya cordata TaxID=56857 RepID=A0A200R528_MACCD|nr:Pentatricopeptide repeat [Macleaya cordata]
MVSLFNISIENPLYCLFPSSSCLRDRINLLQTKIKYNHHSSHRVCLKNLGHVSKSIKSDNAFQPFDESPQLISLSTNRLDSSGYVEEPELGTTGTANFAKTNSSHDAVMANKSLDTLNVSNLPDRLSLISFLSDCSRVGSLDLGKRCHALVIKIGFHHDKFVATSLVSMYSKCGDIENARKMFDGSSDWDIISWNSLISGYSSNGLFNEALNFCMKVLSMGITPSHYTFSIGLSVCGTLLAVQEGKQLHAHTLKLQYLSNTAVGNSLLTMYSKFGMMEEVEILFKELPDRNLISWTAIITGFYQQKCFGKALRQFYCMIKNGVDPNEHTFTVALASCGGLLNPKYGRMVHAQAIKYGMVSGVFVGTAILDMYSETEQMDDAEKQFKEMGSVASDVSWNALVAGYVRNGKTEEAMEAFDRMLGNNILCDQFTYSNILKVCSSIPSLSSGEQIHARIIKTSFESNMHVGCSLIEMYAKCGSLTDAEQVFRWMPIRDVISWNSIIKAYSQNGYPSQAMTLFRKMVEEGTKPTSATFVAVLSACSHSGLVEEGLEHFGSMIGDYMITLEETHFSCMVDLLGRAGQLENAKDFASNLPIKPNASIWRPLLAACRCHKNLKIAEFAAQRVMEMEPGDPTVYITLSNMYAEAGRWDDVEKVRKLMELKEVKKEPGCSWIEVRNNIYKFYSRDMKHSEMPKIYGKLMELVKQIKDMGYVPDTSFVLHQGLGVPKEEQVLYHSEKLAVCFGLLNSPAGRPIRVFKNLRVCRDCHSAMKYISDISKRDIVLRDNYRFHYFKQGSCSCGDYW